MKVPNPALEDYFDQIARASTRISAMIQFTKEYETIGVNDPAWQDCRTLVDTAAKEAPLGEVMVNNDLPAGMEVFADQTDFQGLLQPDGQCGTARREDHDRPVLC